jgi:hypothetical protein
MRCSVEIASWNGRRHKVRRPANVGGRGRFVKRDRQPAAGSGPGGRAAADARREIGSTFGINVYLILTMGRDIAAYASKL